MKFLHLMSRDHRLVALAILFGAISGCSLTVDEPGDWKAELLDENDTVVQAIAFTATGESYKRPKAEPEPSATP